MNSWINATPIEPILTIERKGGEYGDVIIHKSAEELEQIIRDNPGTLGGLARLALEILSLRRDYAILLERWKEASKTD